MFRLVISALLITALALTGCGGSKPTTGIGQATNEAIEKMPDYVTKTPADPNIHYEWGTGLSRDLSLATSKAAQDAQRKMAQFLETRFQGLIEEFKEELNASEQGEYLEQFTLTTKSVISTTLHGVTTEKNDFQNDDGKYRVYVLMSMPIGAAAEALNQQLQAQKDLYTRYRASEAFKRMDEELQKYEDWKKEQGR